MAALQISATAPSVLLVDDNPANLIALSAVLKPLGARLVEARSGAEAIGLVEREPFAVVLMDVQMPEMDGFAAATHIRRTPNGREVPIVFLTAIHRDDTFVKRGYATGAADYITKPFDADVVRARVKAFIDLFKQREDVRRTQVAQRTQERDEALRRLVAFERIATSALKSDDIDAFFRELLQVFMGTADAADSAAILIKEGDELVTKACVGLNEEVDPPALRIGDGFAGRIAETMMPLEVEDVASSPLIKSEWLRARGTRGLFGVPLVHDGEVLGVAHIGSVTASKFDDPERRLFVAIAERAAWAVAQHRTRARALEAERQARQAAELASRMKDEFLATVSHELRTPLNAVLGWTMTARSKQPPPDVDRALVIVERNARAQVRIIDDILDMARIVSGRMRLDISEVDVGETVLAALEAVRPAATAKALAIETRGLDGIGSVRADAGRLQQICWNLLSNAVKFTEKGGHVTADVRREGDDVVIEVSDDGIGIPAEFLPHVFEPFRQADASTTRRHTGLGLGLAIVKNLVDAHGGSIAVKSDGAEKGTTITVKLPSEAAAAVESSARLRTDRTREPEGPLRLDGVKVLVVDDDEDARALLRDVLSDRGAVVEDASSAHDGFAALEKFRPDVLVSDIAMPGGDGFGLMRAVRALPEERGGRTPAIALTAHGRLHDSDRALAVGFQRHLTKPVDLAELASMVRRLAGRSIEEIDAEVRTS